MSNRIAYCPYCGGEVALEGIEYLTGNLIWARCKRMFCRGGMVEVTTDPQGFVLTPMDKAGWYVFSRTKRENMK